MCMFVFKLLRELPEYAQIRQNGKVWPISIRDSKILTFHVPQLARGWGFTARDSRDYKEASENLEVLNWKFFRLISPFQDFQIIEVFLNFSGL